MNRPLGFSRLRRLAWYDLAVLLGGIGWTGWLLARPRPHAAQTISNFGLSVIPMVAAAACIVRVWRAQHRSRSAWAFLGAACFAWGSGQWIWTAYETFLGREVPFPSAADAGYLAAVPLAAIGLVLLPVISRRLAGALRSVVDGLVVATGLFCISWALIVGPLVRAGGDSRLALGISLAYPLGDVVTLTILLFAVIRAGGRRQNTHHEPLWLLALGLASLAIADSGFVYTTSQSSYASGSFIDIGWFAGFALIYAAARQPARREPANADEVIPALGASALPYVPVIGAAVTLVLLRLSGRSVDTVTVTASMVLLTLCGVRHILTQAENIWLLRTLAQRVEDRTAELRRSEERFRSLVQNSSDVVTIADVDSTIRYQSPAVRKVFGYDQEALEGSSAANLVVAPDRQGFLAVLEAVAAGDPYGMVVGEFDVLDVSGLVRAAEITVTNLLHDPSVGGLVLNTRDIDDQKRLQRELTHQAFHDSLTGLANRALFKDRIELALARQERHGGKLAVLFLDCDRFKAVKDSFGHAFGDALLKAISGRLVGCTRKSDTVARLGGDEFAILIENLAGEPEMQAVADRVRESFRDPIAIDGQEVMITASVGVVTSDLTGETADDLLRNADLAMYQAKAAGGATCRHYAPEMHSGVVDRLELEKDLHRAVEREELYLEYQPIVDTGTGAVTGAEALVRWRHPRRGIVPPGSFIPVAEATGLIVPIGEWVLREATRQARRWDDLTGGDRLSIAVNVSPRQLKGSALASVVPQALLEAGLDPSRLVLEMTENALIEHTDETMALLYELRRLGVRLAIDDFGTGFSSLSYLHRFPVDVLKIDRSFVEGLSYEAPETTLAGSIIRIGQGLRLTTVAEGVEDADQWQALRELGCDLAQGYHFARPMASADFEAYVLYTRASPQRPSAQAD